MDEAITGHLRLVPTAGSPSGRGRPALHDLGLTLFIFLVAAFPLASALAGAGEWDQRTLGAGAVQVLLELGVHQAGTYEFSAVSVAYRAGGLRYRATYPFALRVCASSGMTRTCPPLELSSSALARGLPEVVVVGRRLGPRSSAVERARHGRPEHEDQCQDERRKHPPAHG